MDYPQDVNVANHEMYIVTFLYVGRQKEINGLKCLFDENRHNAQVQLAAHTHTHTHTAVNVIL